MNVRLSYTTSTDNHPLIEETIGTYFDKIVNRFPDHEALVVRHQLRQGKPIRCKRSTKPHLLKIS